MAWPERAPPCSCRGGTGRQLDCGKLAKRQRGGLADEATAISLRDALAATKDLPTPLGSFSFDENRNAKQATFVQTIKGGKFVLLGQ